MSVTDCSDTSSRVWQTNPSWHLADNSLCYVIRHWSFVFGLSSSAYLVPSFSFGENNLYKVRLRIFPGTKIGAFRRFYKWLFGYPPVLVDGRWGLLPFQGAVHTIGKFSAGSLPFLIPFCSR